MNRFIQNLPAAKYHADDIGESVPTLTQSIANEMVTRSPWHAHRLHPKLGAKLRATTDAKDAGSLMHSLLLGQEHEFGVVDLSQYRTAKGEVAKDFKCGSAREARDEMTARGKTVVTKSDFDTAMQQAARIDNTLRREHGIELGRMQRELTAVWSEKTDILGQVPVDVVCRARLDAFDGSTVYDLKTCNDASKSKLERSVLNFGYHVQGTAYTSAVERVDIRRAGRVNFVLIFIENDTGAIVLCDLDATLREMGRTRWQEAVNAWRSCLASGTWPGYSSDGPMTLEGSEWAKMNSDSEVRSLRRKVS